MRMPHVVYPLSYGPLGCLHLWAIVNNATVNTGVQVSECLLFDYIPRSEMAGHITICNMVPILYLAF